MADQSAISANLKESARATIGAMPESVMSTASTVKDPVNVPAVSKWPWKATFLIGAVLLVFYFMIRVGLWCYVTGHDEAAETEDFQQLKDIAESADTLVVMVIGAIFGIGGGQGIAAASTAAAEQNGAIAKHNADAANEGRAVAEQNRNVALGAAQVAGDIATAVQVLKRRREDDASRFLAAAHGNTLQFNMADTVRIDSDLEDLAETAQRIVDELRGKIGGR